jgi:uncharacterized protein (DUF885 family)
MDGWMDGWILDGSWMDLGWILDGSWIDLDFIASLAKKIDRKLPQFFGKLPRCPYAIQPVPANQAPSEASGFYVGSDAACTRSGIYYVNTYDLPSRPSYGLYSLTLHEAVPGHHLQLALQAELFDIPMFRKFGDWTAFIEGWALYSESLGVDMGMTL